MTQEIAQSLGTAVGGVIGLILLFFTLALAVTWIFLPWILLSRLKKIEAKMEFQTSILASIDQRLAGAAVVRE